MNNSDEMKSLIVKRESIITRLKNKLMKLLNINERKPKNYTKTERRHLNLKPFTMNCPEFQGMTEDEIYDLIDKKDKEYKERIEFEEKIGKSFDEFINDTNEKFKSVSLYNAYKDEHDNSSKKMESMIADKNSYDLVMKKLDSGEITESQLSTSDLLKINLMLKSEIEIKKSKYDIDGKLNFDTEIERLVKEISELENIINKNL